MSFLLSTTSYSSKYPTIPLLILLSVFYRITSSTNSYFCQLNKIPGATKFWILWHHERTLIPMNGISQEFVHPTPFIKKNPTATTLTWRTTSTVPDKMTDEKEDQFSIIFANIKIIDIIFVKNYYKISILKFYNLMKWYR